MCINESMTLLVAHSSLKLVHPNARVNCHYFALHCFEPEQNIYIGPGTGTEFTDITGRPTGVRRLHKDFTPIGSGHRKGAQQTLMQCRNVVLLVVVDDDRLLSNLSRTRSSLYRTSLKLSLASPLLAPPSPSGGSEPRCRAIIWTRLAQTDQMPSSRYDLPCHAAAQTLSLSTAFPLEVSPTPQSIRIFQRHYHRFLWTPPA